jgi:Holliday junction DNA helicase RuvA
MIAYLSGTVLEKTLDSIVLNVNGVGYLVTVTGKILQEAEVGNEIAISTYLAVRETAMDLYGFSDKSELEMFELLLTISGIGPKSAMGIMSSTTVETLTEGIGSGDAAYLSKMSGIGKKNAEKIILGLKDKIGDLSSAQDSNSSAPQSNNTVAIDALVSLGYSERESRETVQAASKNIPEGAEAEDIIKEALKKLG